MMAKRGVMRSIYAVIAGALVAGLSSTFSFASSDRSSMPITDTRAAPIAATHSGQVEGMTAGELNVFKGIPFAEAPRWKQPMPVKPWSEIKPVKEFGPVCYQPKVGHTMMFDGTSVPAPAMSENCLNLNIWAPKNARGVPVLFWIYGGAFWTGSGSVPMYDGAHLAERGMIVVTINYRVGPLGFLALPELSRESGDGTSGNYGLLDQIAALRWVKANIAAFGGDPAHVTIAGQSAGGMSVVALMASPAARGLFAQAIAQSSLMPALPEMHGSKHGLPSAEQIGSKLAEALQAPTLAVLRAMDPAQVTDAAMQHGYMPQMTVDGRLLPQQLIEIFREGRQAHVPLLAGFTSGEMRSLKQQVPKAPASAAEYESTIRSRYGDLAAAFLALYPAADMAQSILAASRDATFGWSAETLVRTNTDIGKPAYLYYFDHGYPAADAAGLHAFHASELPFQFGTIERTPTIWPKILATAESRTLSDAMLDYWASFVATGKPSAKGQPDWPAYTSNAAYMSFAAAPTASHKLLPGTYDLIDSVACRRRESGKQGWGAFDVGVGAPTLPAKTPKCQR